jgi:hypothetical protein
MCAAHAIQGGKRPTCNFTSFYMCDVARNNTAVAAAAVSRPAGMLATAVLSFKRCQRSFAPARMTWHWWSWLSSSTGQDALSASGSLEQCDSSGLQGSLSAPITRVTHRLKRVLAACHSVTAAKGVDTMLGGQQASVARVPSGERLAALGCNWRLTCHPLQDTLMHALPGGQA